MGHHGSSSVGPHLSDQQQLGKAALPWGILWMFTSDLESDVGLIQKLIARICVCQPCAWNADGVGMESGILCVLDILDIYPCVSFAAMCRRPTSLVQRHSKHTSQRRKTFIRQACWKTVGKLGILPFLSGQPVSEHMRFVTRSWMWGVTKRETLRLRYVETLLQGCMDRTLIVALSHIKGDGYHLTVEAKNFSMKAAIEAQAVLRLVSRVFGRTHR